MNSVYCPIDGLSEATRACRSAEAPPTVLVLPTTESIIAHPDVSRWTCVGRGGSSGIHRQIAVLARLRAANPPTQIISYSDQLCDAAETTMQIDSPDNRIFLSPFETILNSKYGFRLLVWSASGLLSLPPSSSAVTIAHALVTYLRDCDRLAGAWQERWRQVERSVEFRFRNGRRQLRFLYSSVANIHAFDPHPKADELFDRIDALEELLEGLMPA